MGSVKHLVSLVMAGLTHNNHHKQNALYAVSLSLMQGRHFPHDKKALIAGEAAAEALWALASKSKKNIERIIKYRGIQVPFRS